jgi:hypothetical protein
MLQAVTAYALSLITFNLNQQRLVKCIHVFTKLRYYWRLELGNHVFDVYNESFRHYFSTNYRILIMTNTRLLSAVDYLDFKVELHC